MGCLGGLPPLSLGSLNSAAVPARYGPGPKSAGLVFYSRELGCVHCSNKAKEGKLVGVYNGSKAGVGVVWC